MGIKYLGVAPAAPEDIATKAMVDTAAYPFTVNSTAPTPIKFGHRWLSPDTGIESVWVPTTTGGTWFVPIGDIPALVDTPLTGNPTAPTQARGDDSTRLATTGFVQAALAKGGGTDRIFFENDQTVNTSYTLTSGKNAMTAGPVTIASGAVVTVPSGSIWTVV